jgi:hypothetical protein
MWRKMYLSVVAEDETVQLSVRIEEELGDSATRFLQASRVNPMHGVTPRKEKN